MLWKFSPSFTQHCLSVYLENVCVYKPVSYAVESWGGGSPLNNPNNETSCKLLNFTEPTPNNFKQTNEKQTSITKTSWA